MCINCRQQAIRQLCAMLHLGQDAPVPLPPDLSPAGQQKARVMYERIGGQAATLCGLTMPTDEDAESIVRNPDQATKQAVEDFFATLPDDQVWFLCTSLDYFAESTQAAADIAKGLLAHRAEHGNLQAALYLVHIETMTRRESHEFTPPQGDHRAN